MSKMESIFKDEWQYILEVYSKFICPPGSKTVNERLPAILLEMGVRFGERLSQYQMNGYVEIGCGMAIPSLTIAKLGCRDVLAIDIDSKVVLKANQIKEKVGCDFVIRCADVFKDRPKLQKGQMLIAEKPASYKKNTLEVEYIISNWCKIEGHNFAIIPTFMSTDTQDSYGERCAKYEKKFRQVGFNVENKQVCDELPMRWLIAVK
ncbi:MAG: hypothetical protein J7L96_06620 [Bacteroidales bacterium]|nr:hypothetical protein [Bacteroidales bacterium]